MHKNTLRRRAAMALAALAGFTLSPLQAAIVTLGDVSNLPASGTVDGALSIGGNAFGRVTVNAGSALTSDRMFIGGGPTGTGELVVTGAGSQGRVTWLQRPDLLPNNLDIGGAGNGTLQVLAGGQFSYGAAGADCALNCRVFVGNAAGSTGSILVSGVGSGFSTPGGITVGQASVFSQAVDGFTYGIPGASTSGNVRVDGAGSLSAGFMTVGARGGGSTPPRTGQEQTFGDVTVSGSGSTVTLTRDAARTGDQALLAVGTGGNGAGSFQVLSGGRLQLDGSATSAVFTGINVGSGDGTSQGLLRVDGAGSVVHLQSGLGFINVGSSANANGTVQITGGGRVEGSDNGLPFLNVGRRGGSGTVTVSGGDAAGNASTLRLSDRNPNTDAGAFLNIARTENGLASTGTVNVLAGGRIEIDTRARVLTNPNGLPGFYVGVGDGSQGSLTVSGRNAATGAASTLLVQSGTGLANYVGVGRDGANGALLVSGGGQVIVASQHVSTGSIYASGEGLFFDIGRRIGTGSAPSTGTVTVTGAGSLLELQGATDRFIAVGRGNGATGTLTVSAGARLSALGLLAGQEAGGTGTVNINGGIVQLDGAFTGGPAAGTGAGASIGRNGGIGTMNIGNGSVVSISSTAPQAGFGLGGTPFQVGGTGTATVSGGSTLTVTSPGARVWVGRSGTAGQQGTGTLSVVGAGSQVVASGAGAAVLVGAAADTSGTLVVGQGASVSATDLIGLAHDGQADTGGTAVMVVNGTVTAARIVVGSAAVVGGNGTLVGDVTNHGVIGPGLSPGTLRIDGAFDGADGTLHLEVEQQSDGSWLFDRLVFGSPALVNFGSSRVVFDFLGDSDPEAFQRAGLFTIGSFFQEVAGDGSVRPVGSDRHDWFGAVGFDATSPAYRFTSFSFTAADGASLAVVPNGVPLPASWALVGLGLLALRSRRR